MEYEKVEVNSERWFDLKDLKNEVWKDIKDYEKIYKISNYGRVKSLKKSSEKILKQEYSKDGYLRVDLYNNKIKKHKKVHRLVIESFENTKNIKCINHIDENKHNNLLNNLEICDFSYNINYGNRNKKVANKLSKKINQYDLNGNLIKTWDSMIEISRKNDIKLSDIYLCCKNKKKNCKNFIFQYFTK